MKIILINPKVKSDFCNPRRGMEVKEDLFIAPYGLQMIATLPGR